MMLHTYCNRKVIPCLFWFQLNITDDVLVLKRSLSKARLRIQLFLNTRSCGASTNNGGQRLHCLANLARSAFGFRRLPCAIVATPALVYLVDAASCRCRRPLDACGDHRAACPRSGLLRLRGATLERALGPRSQSTSSFATSTSVCSAEMTEHRGHRQRAAAVGRCPARR